jgi:tRNA-dihydrouridine synthase B
MVSAKALWYEDKRSFDLLRTSREEAPIAFQLFGSEPEILASTTETLENWPNAIVDLNMGCPVNKIVKNGEGSALMRNPDLAGRIIERMVSKTKKPVTVKIRKGWGAGDSTAVEIAKIAEEAGASGVAVHGRTREQFYSGRVDLDVIAAVKDSVGIPVIGSGDIFSAEDAFRMMDYTSCDAVMIARGALGNPWIFKYANAMLAGRSAEEIAAMQPTMPEKGEMFLSHLRRAFEDKGEYIAVREMRKQVGWYFKGLPGINKLKVAANRISDKKEFENVIKEFSSTLE